ncbi:hypothetical protein PAPYR_1068 [Paratrimastix pyriformis]|uniref:Uncharacterized protein n=1 Tax=Paratrimastix pyriformis TaxID=342808 RepID=A0ABQ8UTH6_9EUKA|nr:hypothetical protein PAPYR_1068 [Paratrimastix pyriformis]
MLKFSCGIIIDKETAVKLGRTPESTLACCKCPLMHHHRPIECEPLRSCTHPENAQPRYALSSSPITRFKDAAIRLQPPQR